MGRQRFASALAILWAAVQAYALSVLDFYPPTHVIGWLLFATFVAIAVALWRGAQWGRVAFVVLGAVMLLLYGYTFYSAGYVCTSLGCHAGALAQPVLIVLGLVALVGPWPLTIVGGATSPRLQ